MVFGLREQPAVESPPMAQSDLDPAVIDGLRGLVGDAHVLTDDATRRRRTRGKSTPDLLRARSGDLSDAPDVVVRPGDSDEVAAVLEFAVEQGLAVVPFGGGTSVTGGLVARREGYAGVLSLDLVRMKRLLAVDEISMTATLEPGLRGPEAEALLAMQGLTLGHFPQSFEFASIGGFAATRSSGQASAGYGRFDAMVVAMSLATPRGRLDLGRAPADAAGPDLRQLFLGSEGTLGVITSLTLRVRRQPEARVYEGWRWASFESGATAMRTLAQSGMLPTVIRLSDEAETAINLADPGAVGTSTGSTTGDDATTGDGCLMIVGFEGEAAAVEARRGAVSEVLAGLGGVDLGAGPGEAWARARFDAPYLRDSLLDVGVLVETLETATFWSNLDRVYAGVKSALESQLGQPSIVLCHVSHVYETGCSLYFTVAANETDDPLAQWSRAKSAANDAILAAGATNTHHHAIGTDHNASYAEQNGPTGTSILRAIKAELDPAGILNPGVLIP
jgi:alkyldihydroxyacetonephosphate synthase